MNKLNRAANELPPTVGSRSLARTIGTKRRKGEEVTLIDHFGIAHYSEKKKEMVSEKAKKIWSGIQNDTATSSSTPAEICSKWLKRIPGHLKGSSAPKKEILANVRLREQVEHERKRAEASEEKVQQLTEMCSTLLKENEDTKRKMGYVLDQLARFTSVQLPQEFVSGGEIDSSCGFTFLFCLLRIRSGVLSSLGESCRHTFPWKRFEPGYCKKRCCWF